jgi:hypothetical protein
LESQKNEKQDEFSREIAPLCLLLNLAYNKAVGSQIDPAFHIFSRGQSLALLLVLAIGIFMVINPLSWLVGGIYRVYWLIRKLFSHIRSKRMQPPV